MFGEDILAQTKKKKKTTANKKNTQAAAAAPEKKKYKGSEILVLAAFAFCVLLFLGNLNLAGRIGQILKSFQLGMFGTLGYIFPLYLLWFVLFDYINMAKVPANTCLKLGASFIAYVSACGLTELLGGRSIRLVMTLAECYEHGAEGLNGGWFGGLFYLKLYPVIGVLGTYVVMIALLVISFVLATGRSLIQPLQENGERVLRNVKEDRAYHREVAALRREEAAIAKEERRRQDLETRRSDLRARSLAFGEETRLRGTDADSPEETGSVQTVSSDQPGLKKKKKVTAEEIAKAEEKEKQNTQKGRKGIGREYLPQKDKRTLGELNAMDHPSDPNLFVTLKKEKDSEETDGQSRVLNLMPVEPVIHHQGLKEEPAQEPPREQDDGIVIHASAGTVQGGGQIHESPAAQKEEEPEELKVKEEINEKPASGTEEQKEKPAAADVETPAQKEYQFPPLSLLQRGNRNAAASSEQLRETALKLQQTLRSFGVGVTVTDICYGPTVTRYELQPDQGVKVSRIVSLQNDIKLNLAATDIRIEAPIPGKSAVGIEVPNPTAETVFLRDILESESFKKSSSKITFGVGKGISGDIVVSDLAKMPHLLIAGATGNGKSVFINTLVMSILYKARPDEVKLIMIDPKVVELSVYNGIPHLLVPVVTDPKMASGALNWAVVEMEDRYNKFFELGVRDIRGYNNRVKAMEDPSNAPLPQIVVIVDEMADLMMAASNEVEDAICRLAQKARAAGIHLVLATQRPSVDVITGLIKANVQSRIAFGVSSAIDSRTILDMGGAEKLLGKGDMLFYPSSYPKPVRIQGSFVSDEEVEAIVSFINDQTDEPVNTQALERKIAASVAKDAGTVGAGDRDELFEQVGRFIIEKDKATIGNLQRAFRIGFNRAARIMDQLADYGVVGPDEGTKAREILMTMEDFEGLLNRLNGE